MFDRAMMLCIAVMLLIPGFAAAQGKREDLSKTQISKFKRELAEFNKEIPSKISYKDARMLFNLAGLRTYNKRTKAWRRRVNKLPKQVNSCSKLGEWLCSADEFIAVWGEIPRKPYTKLCESNKKSSKAYDKSIDWREKCSEMFEQSIDMAQSYFKANGANPSRRVTIRNITFPALLTMLLSGQ